MSKTYFSLLVLLALVKTGVSSEPPRPPVTAIRDVVYDIEGNVFRGTITFVPHGFPTTKTPPIVSIPVQDGFLSVKLAPTTDLPNPAFYTVTFAGDANSIQWIEEWSVPLAKRGLYTRDVRVGAPFASADSPVKSVSLPLPISDIASLSGDLAQINGSLSNLTSVVNQLVSTVQISESKQQVRGEIPVGTINGENATFSLANQPAEGSSVILCKNGMRLVNSIDYNIVQNIITFLPQSIPNVGDALSADYIFFSKSKSEKRVVSILPTKDIALPIPISDVTGLSGDLAQINGQLSTITTTVNQLQTSIQSLTDMTGVYGEIPGGSINGSNATFTVRMLPTNNGIALFKNGLRQTSGTDYSISRQTITFTAAAIPQSGDTLQADYTSSAN